MRNTHAQAITTVHEERKVRSTRANVSHRMRTRFRDGCMHVSVRVKRGLPSLRTPKARARILKAMREFQDRFEVRIVCFSILSNHVHLLVEAKDERELARAMKGFLVRVARSLNRLWERTGSVWADRYFARIVKKTVHRLRKVIRYVMQNARKHGIPLPPDRPDPYSSGLWFRSWGLDSGYPFTDEPRPVQDPRDMMLGHACRTTFRLDERPSALPRPEPKRPGKRRRLYTLR
jgi:REP element-mobilizing transposase RayT